jgi:microcystin degradation protein MlrC
VLEGLAPSHLAPALAFSSRSGADTLATPPAAAAAPGQATGTASSAEREADAELQAAAAAAGQAAGGLLDASVGVGYQWIDSPTVGGSALAVVDARRARPGLAEAAAQRLADALGHWVWSRRGPGRDGAVTRPRRSPYSDMRGFRRQVRASGRGA